MQKRLALFLYLGLVTKVFAANLPQADLVTVEKSKRTMYLFQNGIEIRRYRIALGDSPRGHKVKEGDQRTPQGRYILDYKNENSAYYRSIHISYPNEADKLRAEVLGVDPGGQIMIHGQKKHAQFSPKQQQRYNWTNGCIAVTNEEMDDLWQLITPGTPIEIWP